MLQKLGTAKLTTVLAAVLALTTVVRQAQASSANLFFSPTYANYTLGQNFSVDVNVSSPDQSINAVSGVIVFPPSQLEVVEISTTDSIVDLWVQEPHFSNSNGNLSFEGIILNPGYQGHGGKIMRVVFAVKSGGNAFVRFSSGAVLANDGSGTNIISHMGSATYELSRGPTDTTNPAASTPKPPSTAAAALPAPQIFSPTHPDQNKWYANSNPRFEWVNPPGVTGVSIRRDQNPNSDPGPVSDGNFSSYHSSIRIEDGIWYFHLKQQNSAGWGGIAHYRFQIDTVAPEFLSVELVKEDTQTGRAGFAIQASDATSVLIITRLK